MRCSTCKRQIKTSAFATFRTRNGEIRRRGICKECRGKYARDNFSRLKKWRQDYNLNNRNERAIRSAERRKIGKEAVDLIKSRTPCADCGRKFPPVAMDFDHIGGKNMGVATMVAGAYKMELILEEIKLCDIVCACCHRIRTAARKQNHAPHRTVLLVGAR